MSRDFLPTLGNKKHYLGDYLPLKSIGKGAFAEVKLARHWLTGTDVAVKTISRWGTDTQFEEVQSLKSLHHPNITQLFQVLTTRDKETLFMEFVSGGDLFRHLEDCGRLSEDEARAMFRQMVSALHYCHGKGIAHRDLKPQNMLLDRHLNIKVADFGFSRNFRDYRLSTFCGTLSYMAPEVLRRQIYDGPKADVWSLGVILHEMVTGKAPFQGDTAADMVKAVKEVGTKPLQLPEFTSEEVRALLRKLLTVDPHLRPNLEHVMRDPWVNKGQGGPMSPYREPPWAEIDPQLVKIMRDLGFTRRELEDSVALKKYDRVMATYLILRAQTARMPGRTVRVRPGPAPAPDSSGASSGPDLEAAGPSATAATPSLEDGAAPSPGGLGARKKGPRAIFEVRLCAAPPSLESGSLGPPGSLEETVGAPPPRPQPSSSAPASTREETVRAPPPRPQPSSSAPASTREDTVRAPPPRPQPSSSASSPSASSPSASSSTEEETVPAPPPSAQSSSSGCTCTVEEDMPAPTPSLKSRSSEPGPDTRTATPSLGLQCIPGGALASSSSSSSGLPAEELDGSDLESSGGRALQAEGTAELQAARAQPGPELRELE
ncbi:sperm motility kinase 4A-like [Pteronotus mesoamericanus]|uniref:sperm motility kinase 4A-like n=1 Tax=Pteronotus mesoamericanus TaxID=1884717 RepID=UPI0023EC3D90|nr:sperm motility kinase 4A-like [Pteronotus parnellii mesoamericanus]